jgi:aryl-alcohol dehydrogenase-like predicted oxidoreductase
MFERTMGRSGIKVSALGMGCWAIGGPWWWSDGRTIAWIRALSERAIPIPGFKTVAQVEENARAMGFGPLSLGQMEEVERIMEKGVAVDG